MLKMKKTLATLLLVGTLFTANAQKKDWTYHSMEASYVGLRTTEYFQTVKGIKYGAMEGNPIMRKVVNNPLSFALTQTAVTGGTLFLLRDLKKSHPKLAKGILIGANAFYTYVVYNNHNVIKGVKNE